jgi:hypothetical protein
MTTFTAKEAAGAKADARFAARSAIEALRAGVPNSAGVRALGCDQPRIEREFLNQLDSVVEGATAEGMIVKGDFGTGKSHCLEYLREIALDRRFVVSRIYVNKETPLHDPVKLFQGAAEGITLPGRTGPAFLEIANQLVFNSQPFREFERWANHAATGLDARLPASLLLFERCAAEHEFRDQLIRFWGGGKLPVSDVRSRLRQLGEPYIPGHLSHRDLAGQRFRFASRLMRAAGYAGWVVLIDEVELVGTYSSLQRARSYIEIARLHALAAEQGIALIPVLAITDDFTRAILGDKDDLNRIPKLIEGRPGYGEGGIVPLAVEGMRLLAENGISLKRPDMNALDETFAHIAGLYALAYGWKPPAEGPVRREQSTPFREYIRRWITEWDIRRLYPESKIDIETSEWRTDYSEKDDEAEDAEEVASGQSLIDDVLRDIG